MVEPRGSLSALEIDLVAPIGLFAGPARIQQSVGSAHDTRRAAPRRAPPPDSHARVPRWAPPPGERATAGAGGSGSPGGDRRPESRRTGSARSRVSVSSGVPVPGIACPLRGQAVDWAKYARSCCRPVGPGQAAISDRALCMHRPWLGRPPWRERSGADRACPHALFRWPGPPRVLRPGPDRFPPRPAGRSPDRPSPTTRPRP